MTAGIQNWPTWRCHPSSIGELGRDLATSFAIVRNSRGPCVINSNQSARMKTGGNRRRTAGPEEPAAIVGQTGRLEWQRTIVSNAVIMLAIIGLASRVHSKPIDILQKQYMWVATAGSVEPDNSFPQIAADNSGNVYLLVPFGEEFGSSWPVVKLNPSTGTKFGAILAKFSPSGENLWNLRFNCSGDIGNLGLGVDAVGNAFCIGRFSDRMNADSISLISESEWGDGFLIKVSPDGVPQWAKQSPDDYVDIPVTEMGEIRVVESLWTSDQSSVRVSKLDTTGATRWSVQVPGADPRHAVIDSAGETIVAGDFSNDFPDCGGGRCQRTSLLRVGENGMIKWVREVVTAGTWESGDTRIAVDKDGNIYMSDSFFGEARFGDKVLINQSKSNEDVYLAKLNHEGRLIWIRQYGGSDSDHVYDLSVTTDGGVLLCGGSGFAPSRGFLIHYNAGGQLEWFRHEFGGSSFALSGTTKLNFSRLASTRFGILFASGIFSEPHQIGGARQLGFGSDDYFLVRLAPAELSEPSLEIGPSAKFQIRVPNYAAGYELQTSSSMAEDAVWRSMGELDSLIDSNGTVIGSHTATTGYFRLRKR